MFRNLLKAVCCASILVGSIWGAQVLPQHSSVPIGDFMAGMMSPGGTHDMVLLPQFNKELEDQYVKEIFLTKWRELPKTHLFSLGENVYVSKSYVDKLSALIEECQSEVASKQFQISAVARKTSSQLSAINLSLTEDLAQTMLDKLQDVIQILTGTDHNAKDILLNRTPEFKCCLGFIVYYGDKFNPSSQATGNLNQLLSSVGVINFSKEVGIQLITEANTEDAYCFLTSLHN